jgi:hypothetical protein
MGRRRSGRDGQPRSTDKGAAPAEPGPVQASFFELPTVAPESREVDDRAGHRERLRQRFREGGPTRCRTTSCSSWCSSACFRAAIPSPSPSG